MDLRELELSNRKFTWANSRTVPTFETLCHILVTTEWKAKFPLATVRALSRDISDHTPLLMSTGNGTHSNKQPLFKFELGWLLRAGFLEMVAQVWNEETRGQTPLQKWQFKIQRLRQFLRGWAKNTSGTYRKEKQEIIKKADELDKKAETKNA